MVIARNIWNEQYPDVPWLAEELQVRLPQGLVANTFQFMFGNLNALPNFKLFGKDEEGRLQVIKLDFELSQGPEGAIVMSLAPEDGSRIRAIALLQQGNIRLGQVVCLAKDLGKEGWLVIYNSLERATLLEKSLCEAVDRGRYREVLSMLGFLLRTNTKRAEQLIETSPTLRIQIKDHPWLLEKFSLSHASHGLKKTYKNWTQDEKQRYLREAMAVVESLHVLTPDVCLFGGIALGWQRHQHLLPHDDDLDVMVALDRDVYGDIGMAMEHVAKKLTEAGWKVLAKFFNHLWVKTHDSAAETLDVFVGLIEGGRVSCYTLPRRGLEHSRIFPAAEYLIEGVSVRMPRDMIHYLEVNYGPNWRIPDPNHQSNWDRSRYADIAGRRSYRPMMTRGEVAFLQKQKKLEATI